MTTYVSRDRGDLFRYSFLRFIFRNRIFLTFIRISTLLIFLFALFYGFFAADSTEYHFTVHIFWSFFWPFFMVVSLGSFGSIFCAICPHSFLGRYITPLGLQKNVPKLLQNPLIGLGLLISSYWISLYLFPNLLKTPYIASIFFLVFTFFSLLGFFIFKDMGYCKYFCPIGSITDSFSKTSSTWLSTYQESCKACKDFECAKVCPYHLSPFNFDKKESMESCKLCMECAFACEAVGFFAKQPSSSLYKIDKYAKNSDIWTYIIIASFASISMIFQNALGNSPIKDSLPWMVYGERLDSFFKSDSFSFGGVFVVLLSIFCTIFFTIGIYKITSKIFQLEYEKVFKFAGYSIAPVVIFGGMAQTIPFFFTHYGSDTLNSVIAIFGAQSYISPFLEKSSPILKVFALLHFFGVALGVVVLWRRVRKLGINGNLKRRVSIFILLGSFHIFYLSLICFVIYVFAVFS